MAGCGGPLPHSHTTLLAKVAAQCRHWVHALTWLDSALMECGAGAFAARGRLFLLKGKVLQEMCRQR